MKLFTVFFVLLLLCMNLKSQDLVKTIPGNLYSGKIESMTDSTIVIHDNATQVTFTLKLSEVASFRKDGIQTNLNQFRKSKQIDALIGPYGNGYEISRKINWLIAGTAVVTTGLTMALVVPRIIYNGDTPPDKSQKRAKTADDVKLIGGCIAAVGGIIQIQSLGGISKKFKTLKLVSGDDGIGVRLKF